MSPFEFTATPDASPRFMSGGSLRKLMLPSNGISGTGCWATSAGPSVMSAATNHFITGRPSLIDEGGQYIQVVKYREVKTFILLAALMQASIWTADEHKAAMSDASDLQEDVRDAFAAKAGDKVAAAAIKLEALMGRSEDYWTAKKQADIVTLAQATRALAKQLAADGKTGKLNAAAETFDKMKSTSNACHEKHPEKL